MLVYPHFGTYQFQGHRSTLKLTLHKPRAITLTPILGTGHPTSLHNSARPQETFSVELHPWVTLATPGLLSSGRPPVSKARKKQLNVFRVLVNEDERQHSIYSLLPNWLANIFIKAEQHGPRDRGHSPLSTCETGLYKVEIDARRGGATAARRTGQRRGH